MRNQPIGVMDSGVGGLTVVSEIWRQLPREEILFYGDSARCPYGDRSPAEIAEFTFRALDFLVEQRVKMLVIACNTATAVCLEWARERYDIPVLGVIAPGARAAIAATTNHRVGIIGTRATIASNSYPRALHLTHRGIATVAVACPRFVSIVEQGLTASAEILPVVADSLREFSDANIDTLILGCTHYPLLASAIGQVMGRSVTLINSAEETARDISFVLADQQMTRTHMTEPNHAFLTSGDAEAFAALGARWLGRAIAVSPHDVWECGECFDAALARNL
ncbi:MAG: glutamate racemase [Bacilli bacterium]